MNFTDTHNLGNLVLANLFLDFIFSEIVIFLVSILIADGAFVKLRFTREQDRVRGPSDCLEVSDLLSFFL